MIRFLWNDGGGFGPLLFTPGRSIFRKGVKPSTDPLINPAVWTVHLKYLRSVEILAGDKISFWPELFKEWLLL